MLKGCFSRAAPGTPLPTPPPPPLPPLRRWGNHGGRRWKGGRGPSASVNFITAHDGFTLADLVSYNEKHNLANGEDNRSAGLWVGGGVGMGARDVMWRLGRCGVGHGAEEKGSVARAMRSMGRRGACCEQSIGQATAGQAGAAARPRMHLPSAAAVPRLLRAECDLETIQYTLSLLTGAPFPSPLPPRRAPGTARPTT